MILVWRAIAYCFAYVVIYMSALHLLSRLAGPPQELGFVALLILVPSVTSWTVSQWLAKTKRRPAYSAAMGSLSGLGILLIIHAPGLLASGMTRRQWISDWTRDLSVMTVCGGLLPFVALWLLNRRGPY